MIEFLKLWPAILSLASFITTLAFGGYVLYVRYWLKKEIKEPIASLEEDITEVKQTLDKYEERQRSDIKDLESAISEFKLNILTSNATLVNEFKNALSESNANVSKDLTNLWKTKVDQTALDSKVSSIDSKLHELDNKVSSNQSQVIDYLLKRKGE